MIIKKFQLEKVVEGTKTLKNTRRSFFFFKREKFKQILLEKYSNLYPAPNNKTLIILSSNLTNPFPRRNVHE